MRVHEINYKCIFELKQGHCSEQLCKLIREYIQKNGMRGKVMVEWRKKRYN